MKNFLVDGMKVNNTNLLKLQKLYRKGVIKEDEIPEEQLNDLKELYKEQIYFLETSIEADKQMILRIKNKSGNFI